MSFSFSDRVRNNKAVTRFLEQLSEKLAADYAGKTPLVLCILKGGSLFAIVTGSLYKKDTFFHYCLKANLFYHRDRVIMSIFTK